MCRHRRHKFRITWDEAAAQAAASGFAVTQAELEPIKAAITALPSSARLWPGSAPEPSRHITTSGGLFALKKNISTVTPGFGARSYDYTEKYPADEWGAEMCPESRAYKTYLDESEIFDNDRVAAWRDALDVLLVIIGLFSAIVTTFVVQASLALQPDYGQLTAVMVYNLILVQQSLANNTFGAVPAIQNPLDTSVKPSSVDLWVNALWYASLAISLSAALITTLTKQWLYRYTSQTSGTSQERARLRQFRFAGLENYHVPMIIDLLPVALHLSLALFLVGLAIFLSSVSTGMCVIVSYISGIAYGGYLMTILLPLLDPQCPYQSPISVYLYRFSTSIRQSLLWTLPTQMALSGILCIKGWRALQRQCKSIVLRVQGQPIHGATERSTGPFEKKLLDFIHRPDPSGSPSASLQDNERHAVSQNQHQLDIDAIAWLHSSSSNSTVRDISFQAIVGLPPSDADSSRLRDAIRPYHDDIMRSCCNMDDPTNVKVLPRREEEYTHAMQAVCVRGFEAVVAVGAANIPFIAPILDTKETNGRLVFRNVILHQRYDERIHMDEFFDGGKRGHLCMPLQIWRFILTQPSWDLTPALVLPLLTIPRPTANIVSTTATTLTNALRSNPIIWDRLRDIIVRPLDIQPDSDPSPQSFPVLHRLLKWILDYEDSDSEFDFDLNSDFDLQIFPVLIAIFRQYHKIIHDNPQIINASSRRQIMQACQDFLTRHHLPSPESTDAWDAYCAALRLLHGIWDETMTCSPELFLSFVRRYIPPVSSWHLPSGSILAESLPESVAVARDAITRILEVSPNAGELFGLLRHRDILTKHDRSAHYHEFWGSVLAPVAAFAGPQQVVNIDDEWVKEWIQYIDSPERLFFLCKHLIADNGNNSILHRLVPLIDLTRNSSQWEHCFTSLILLLRDGNIIKLPWGDCVYDTDQLWAALEFMDQPEPLPIMYLFGDSLPRMVPHFFGQNIPENQLPGAIKDWRKEREGRYAAKVKSDAALSHQSASAPVTAIRCFALLTPIRNWLPFRAPNHSPDLELQASISNEADSAADSVIITAP